MAWVKSQSQSMAKPGSESDLTHPRFCVLPTTHQDPLEGGLREPRNALGPL